LLFFEDGSEIKVKKLRQLNVKVINKVSFCMEQQPLAD
jgi:hypothetical protein